MRAFSPGSIPIVRLIRYHCHINSFAEMNEPSMNKIASTTTETTRISSLSTEPPVLLDGILKAPQLYLKCLSRGNIVFWGILHHGQTASLPPGIDPYDQRWQDN